MQRAKCAGVLRQRQSIYRGTAPCRLCWSHQCMKAWTELAERPVRCLCLFTVIALKARSTIICAALLPAQAFLLSCRKGSTVGLQPDFEQSTRWGETIVFWFLGLAIPMLMSTRNCRRNRASKNWSERIPLGRELQILDQTIADTTSPRCFWEALRRDRKGRQGGRVCCQRHWTHVYSSPRVGIVSVSHYLECKSTMCLCLAMLHSLTWKRQRWRTLRRDPGGTTCTNRKPFRPYFDNLHTWREYYSRPMRHHRWLHMRIQWCRGSNMKQCYGQIRSRNYFQVLYCSYQLLTWFCIGRVVD